MEGEVWELPEAYPTLVQVEKGVYAEAMQEWHPITLEMWGLNRVRWGRFPDLAFQWAKAYDLNVRAGSSRGSAEVRGVRLLLEAECARLGDESVSDGSVGGGSGVAGVADEVAERRDRRRREIFG